MSEYALARARARARRRRKRPRGPDLNTPWWYFAILAGSDLIAYVKGVRTFPPDASDIAWYGLWSSAGAAVAIHCWRMERWHRQEGTYVPTPPPVALFLAAVGAVVLGARVWGTWW